MVDLVRKDDWSTIARDLESRSGNYVASVRGAHWSRNKHGEAQIISFADIYEIREVVKDGKKDYERGKIWTTPVIMLNETNSEIKGWLETLGKDNIEDWGEFFVLFDPILEYYRGEYRKYMEAHSEQRDTF